MIGDIVETIAGPRESKVGRVITNDREFVREHCCLVDYGNNAYWEFERHLALLHDDEVPL